MASSSNPPTALPSDDRIGMTIGISVTMTALATLLVATRLYVRKFVSNALGADDMVAVAALVRFKYPPPAGRRRAVQPAPPW